MRGRELEGGEAAKRACFPRGRGHLCVCWPYGGPDELIEGLLDVGYQDKFTPLVHEQRLWSCGRVNTAVSCNSSPRAARGLDGLVGSVCGAMLVLLAFAVHGLIDRMCYLEGR